MPRPRFIQPEDFYLLHNLSDPQMSPDGRRVAYVVSTADRETDETATSVYVARTDGRSPARRFTQGNKDHSPRWSPDGQYLAFVSDRGAKNQLFVAPLDGGEPRQVTKAPHGISQPAWSPDGKRVAHAARTGEYKDPKERTPLEKSAPRVIRDLRYKLDGVGFFDDRRIHIFTGDVETGEEKQVTDGDWNDDHPAWSPDGKRLAFVSDRERQRHQRQWRTDVWVTPAAGGRATKVTRSKGSAAHPAFSPDGKRIAFVGHENGEAGLAKNTHVMWVPADGGNAPRSVNASIDRPAAGWPVFASGRTFAWAPEGDALLYLAGDRGTQAIYRADLGGGLSQKVLAGERQIEAFALAADGKSIAFTAVWSTEPWELYATTLNGRRREVNLSHANGEVRHSRVGARFERMSCRAPDGLEIESFILYPPDYRTGRRYSLALNVHGGPHSFHPGSRSWVEFQSLAAAGYVVLLPNPRGSITYGEAFGEACVRDWGGRDFEDIMASVDEVVLRGIADPERLYIGGYSYGGFMTSWAVGRTERFRAALVGAPVSNQVSMFGTGDIPLFDIHELGGTPHDAEEEYRLRSPVSHLANVRTPVLLVHHEGDLRCPVAQSEEIFHGLKALGHEVEFVRYPGGFHTYNTHAPSQTVDRIERTIAWYDSHGPAKSARERAGGARRRQVKAGATRTAGAGRRGREARSGGPRS